MINTLLIHALSPLQQNTCYYGWRRRWVGVGAQCSECRAPKGVLWTQALAGVNNLFWVTYFALLVAVSTQVVIEMFKLFNDLHVHCNSSVQQLLTEEILVLWQCIYFQFEELLMCNVVSICIAIIRYPQT